MQKILAVFALLDRREKWGFFYAIAILILFSLTESFAFSLLVPYVGLLKGDPAIVERVHTFFGLFFQLGEENLILSFSAVLLVLMSLRALLHVYSSYQTAKLPHQFFCKNAKKLFQGYLRQNYLTFTSQDSSALLKSCHQTSLFAAHALVQTLQLLSFFFVTLSLFAVLLWHNFFVSSFLIFFFTSLGGAIYAIYRKPQQQTGIIREEESKNSYKVVSEALHTFKEVKIYEKEGYFTEQLEDHLHNLAAALRRSVYFPLIPVAVIEYAAVALLIITVVYFFSVESVTTQFIESLVLFAAVGRRLLPSLNQLVSLSMQLQHFAQSLFLFEEEVKKVEGLPPVTMDKRMPFEREIRCERLFFSYKQGVPTLKGVSFTIPKNRSVAFVGPSGAGKSTILNILVSLLSPSCGMFFIDDVEVPNLLPIRGSIGYVPQTIALLNATIAHNIAFGEEKIDQKRLEEVLHMAQLKSFVEGLPSGTETVIGEQGIKLSGGERQRVGIARALYRNPKIVLFDEATASLDHMTETVLSDAIRYMSGQKTVVAIAHRLTTVQHFDLIYVVNEGEIVAQGTHRELLSSCSIYQKLNIRCSI